MNIRYGVNQRDVERYTTQELRDEFLIKQVFVPGDVTAVYSHVDRVITMGAMPTMAALKLDKNIDCWKSLEQALLRITLSNAGRQNCARWWV